MIISRYKVLIQQFGAPNQSVPPQYKMYSIGLYFDASIIKREINSISEGFYTIFLKKFLLPYLLFVAAFLIGQVIFIVYFSNKIFKTINELSDKIQILSD